MNSSNGNIIIFISFYIFEQFRIWNITISLYICRTIQNLEYYDIFVHLQIILNLEHYDIFLYF